MKNGIRNTFSFLVIVVLTWVFACTCFCSCSRKKEKQTIKKEIVEVDFDSSMGKGTPEYQAIFSNQEDVRRFVILKELYVTHAPSKVPNGGNGKDT